MSDYNYYTSIEAQTILNCDSRKLKVYRDNKSVTSKSNDRGGKSKYLYLKPDVDFLAKRQANYKPTKWLEAGDPQYK